MGDQPRHGRETEGAYWPVGTPEDRCSTIAGMIRTADHFHDTRADALRCVLQRVHEHLIADAVWRGLFDSDPDTQDMAAQLTAAWLDGCTINVNLLMLLGDVAAYYQALVNGATVPLTIQLALMEV